MSVSSDTYPNLPAITRLMPAISLASARELHAKTAEGARAWPRQPDAAEGHRWMVWGAARDGARTTVTGRQKLIFGALCVALVICAFTLPNALVLAPVAFITFAYLAAGVYKAVMLLRGEQSVR